MKEQKRNRKEIEKIAKEMTHVDLQNIKDSIGRGYVRRVVEYIKKETGRKYNEPYVRRRLCMNYLSPQILLHAMDLAVKIESGTEKSIEDAKQFLKKKRNQTTK